ncbi:hypothetical protein EV215_0260 [Hypnocyclicus thermotrophus]|uniref:Uncharacterized protein n=1 Tax=Hypnocyclicus thermotrophus TaxID=1627895 RepID=A0AA46E089_9FUSO|nr:hypothetical protein [Hypnocyclicus thermotrophus]TDT72454.1 hypothetical protein EV215_0260 [Hypnocyclicus thermotrophus]
MSGLFKVFVSQVYWLASFDISDEADYTIFENLIENFDSLYSNSNTLSEFLNSYFKDLSTFDVNNDYQQKALTYIKEAITEIIEGIDGISVYNVDNLSDKANIISFDSQVEKDDLLDGLEIIKEALSDEGAIIKTEDGESFRINLSKLYTFDLKKMMIDLTQGITNLDKADYEMEVNFLNSTLGGIFPDGIPTLLKDDILEVETYEERPVILDNGEMYWKHFIVIREYDSNYKFTKAEVYDEEKDELVAKYIYEYDDENNTVKVIISDKNGNETGEYRLYQNKLNGHLIEEVVLVYESNGKEILMKYMYDENGNKTSEEKVIN